MSNDVKQSCFVFDNYILKVKELLPYSLTNQWRTPQIQNPNNHKQTHQTTDQVSPEQIAVFRPFECLLRLFSGNDASDQFLFEGSSMPLELSKQNAPWVNSRIWVICVDVGRWDLMRRFCVICGWWAIAWCCRRSSKNIARVWHHRFALGKYGEKALSQWWHRSYMTWF